MKKNYRGWWYYMRCRGWGFMLLLSGAGVAIAADEPYLQLDTRLVEVPYQWQLPDGEVLRKGVSDQAARVTVVQRKGHEDYVLETIWDRFPVRVPARCWKLQVAQFESCVDIGPRENSTRQSEVEQSIDQEIAARQQNREMRVTWATEQIGLEQVPRILEAAFARHERWLALSSGHADSAAYLCGRLKSALAAVPSQSTLPRRDMMAGRPEAVAAYVQAARGGNWRAAAGLFDAMMADEDFESARVIVAWLLKQNIPAGYNKLGTLVVATSGYDGASEVGQAIIKDLRRHAAWQGDPVAQMELANLLENKGDKMNATRLRACAVEQNSDLER